jgi:hypothetical protein
VTFEEHFDSGNAHPIVTTSALVFDLDAGRALTIAGLADERGRAAIVAACRGMIDDEAVRANDGQRFASIAGDLSAWAIAPTQVTIAFNPNRLVGTDLGFSCTLPIATLRPLLRQDNPLW